MYFLSLLGQKTKSSPAISAATTSAAISGLTLLKIFISTTHRRDRGQVGDPGVEPRTVTQGVGEDPVERRHQPQALVEVVLVLQQQVHHALEVVQGGLEVGPRLLDEQRQLGRELAGGHEQPV